MKLKKSFRKMLFLNFTGFRIVTLMLMNMNDDSNEENV